MLNMFAVFLVILPVCFAQEWTPSSCPVHCTCSLQFSRPLDADLRTVDCDSISLSKIPDGIPEDTQSLILSGNGLTTLKSDQYWPRGLLNLDLGSNRIRSIGKHAPFGRMSRLQRLVLSNNRITQIRANQFEDLYNMETLDLSGNRIASVDVAAFSNLHKLEVLSLQRNHLTYIPDGLWSVLGNLYELNLAGNRLSVIQWKTFQRLMSVLQLDLSNNRILQIHPLAFGDLVRLEYLKLDGNQLRSVPRDAIKVGARTLKSVSFSRNPIYRIKAGDFGEMFELRDLGLDHMNRLQLVESGAFSGFPELLVFQLHDNPQLTYLSPTAFPPSGLPKATHLLLHNNNLPVLSESQVKTMPNLEEISFYGNPISCDCNSAWIRNLMNGQHKLNFREADRLTCDSPVEHKFRTLSSMSPKGLGKFCGPTMLNLAPTQVSAKMGNTVVLDCAAVGNPEPKVTWVLPIGADSAVHKRNGGRTIVISDIGLRMAGVYTCLAENNQGIVTFESRVEVSSSTVELAVRAVGTHSALVAWTHTSGDRSTQLLVFPENQPESTTRVTLNPIMTSFLLENLSPGQTYQVCLSPSPLDSRNPVRSACAKLHTEGQSIMNILSRSHNVALAASLVIAACLLTLALLGIVAMRLRSGSKVVPYTHLDIEEGSVRRPLKVKELLHDPASPKSALSAVHC